MNNYFYGTDEFGRVEYNEFMFDELKEINKELYERKEERND